MTASRDAVLLPAGMGGAAVKDSCCSLARGAGQVVAGSHGEGSVANRLRLCSSCVRRVSGAGACKPLATHTNKQAATENNIAPAPVLRQ